jgi:preprotein translocase subunit SecF
MFIVKKRIIFFILSVVLVLGSIGSIVMYGMNFGIDFTGGSVLQITYLDKEVAPTLDVVKERLSTAGYQNALVNTRGVGGYVIKIKHVTEQEKNTLISSLTASATQPLIVERFNSIGPSVGNELKQKAYVAIAVVLVCIMIFIMFAFRRLRNPLNYGIATIIALAHDVLIPTGVYVIFSHITGVEIDILFVSALLAILGYSVHDTIVVFDRVRENSVKSNNKNFEEVVGESVTQTIGRSINTSITIFITLLALYIFGGETTHHFAFVLLVGVIVGTYSSICVASPLLVTLENWRMKGR